MGLPAKEWALVGLNGNDIYSESRGLLAGYKWPRYALHRGHFHVLLHDKLIEQAGRDAVRLGLRVTGYRRRRRLRHRADRTRRWLAVEANSTLLIGTNGINSAVRRRSPTQPPIRWGGAVMSRGTISSRANPSAHHS